MPSKEEPSDKKSCW